MIKTTAVIINRSIYNVSIVILKSSHPVDLTKGSSVYHRGEDSRCDTAS